MLCPQDSAGLLVSRAMSDRLLQETLGVPGLMQALCWAGLCSRVAEVLRSPMAASLLVGGTMPHLASCLAGVAQYRF